MSISYERLQELYEIADGAFSDGPYMRGRAIEEIKKLGYEYPAREDTVAITSPLRESPNSGE